MYLHTSESFIFWKSNWSSPIKVYIRTLCNVRDSQDLAKILNILAELAMYAYYQLIQYYGVHRPANGPAAKQLNIWYWLDFWFLYPISSWSRIFSWREEVPQGDYFPGRLPPPNLSRAPWNQADSGGNGTRGEETGGGAPETRLDWNEVCMHNMYV